MKNDFNEILFQSILEYFIYNYWYKFYIKWERNKKFISPYYYYRHNELDYLYFSREDLIIKNIINLTEDKIYLINDVVNRIKSKKFLFQEYILNYDIRYKFLFFEIKNKILDPEEICKINLIGLFNLLKENQNNFYALLAYISYFYNKSKFYLSDYFDKALKIDNNNPYILFKYARYESSSLYKFNNKDKSFLISWKYKCIRWIEVLESLNLHNSVTFWYCWLWYIYTELNDYNKAVSLYNKSIMINEKLKFPIPEPFIWRGFVLNKLWKFLESNEQLLRVLNNKVINRLDNDKKDFRFYKVISDNYYNLGDFIKFKKYLNLTIEKYLEYSNFYFEYSNKLLLNKNVTKIDFDKNIILLNNYNSFFEYNKKYIKSNIDELIFSISFLYKEKLLWNKVDFLDGRWLEKLCYNYLTYIYD